MLLTGQGGLPIFKITGEFISQESVGIPKSLCPVEIQAMRKPSIIAVLWVSSGRTEGDSGGFSQLILTRERDN